MKTEEYKQIIDEISFDEKGLVPVITQDKRTDTVLMLAYANKEAIEKTAETGLAHYFSRSRNKLWQKGEESGNIQKIDSIAIDCDGDAVLYKVFQKGNACHTGSYSCFFRKVNFREENTLPLSESIKNSNKSQSNAEIFSNVLNDLYNVISSRKNNPQDGSYTNYLFDKGIDKILKKVGEESSETIIATKNNDKNEIVNETSDLLYHLLVMLVDKGVKIDDVFEELKRRAK